MVTGQWNDNTIKIDYGKAELVVCGKVIELTKTQWGIFTLMVKHKGVWLAVYGG